MDLFYVHKKKSDKNVTNLNIYNTIEAKIFCLNCY